MVWCGTAALGLRAFFWGPYSGAGALGCGMGVANLHQLSEH
eukprot:COSAG02_NODE_25222_length_665_cov_1.242049_1_plen_40_part_10